MRLLAGIGLFIKVITMTQSKPDLWDWFVFTMLFILMGLEFN